ARRETGSRAPCGSHARRERGGRVWPTERSLEGGVGRDACARRAGRSRNACPPRKGGCRRLRPRETSAFEASPPPETARRFTSAAPRRSRAGRPVHWTAAQRPLG